MLAFMSGLNQVWLVSLALFVQYEYIESMDITFLGHHGVERRANRHKNNDSKSH